MGIDNRRQSYYLAVCSYSKSTQPHAFLTVYTCGLEGLHHAVRMVDATAFYVPSIFVGILR